MHQLKKLLVDRQDTKEVIDSAKKQLVTLELDITQEIVASNQYHLLSVAWKKLEREYNVR